MAIFFAKLLLKTHRKKGKISKKYDTSRTELHIIPFLSELSYSKAFELIKKIREERQD